jgi:uncharacterized protein YjbI with pentapeptide repeats
VTALGKPQENGFHRRPASSAVFNDADLQEAKFLCAETGLKVGAESESESDDTKVVPRSTAPSFKVHCSSGRSCRKLLSPEHSSSAPRSRKRKCKGHSWMTRIFRARRSTGPSFNRASLARAQMQEARLELTVLHGATLVDASLAGAWLDNVQLQGASLDGAHLEGAYIKDAGFTLRRSETRAFRAQCSTIRIWTAP